MTKKWDEIQVWTFLTWLYENTKKNTEFFVTCVQCHVFDVQYIYKWITMGSRSPEAIILYTWVERYRMEWCFFYSETMQWQGKVSKPQHSYLKLKALTTNHNTVMTLNNIVLPKLPIVETTMYLHCFCSTYLNFPSGLWLEHSFLRDTGNNVQSNLKHATEKNFKIHHNFICQRNCNSFNLLANNKSSIFAVCIMDCFWSTQLDIPNVANSIWWLETESR